MLTRIVSSDIKSAVSEVEVDASASFYVRGESVSAHAESSDRDHSADPLVRAMYIRLYLGMSPAVMPLDGIAPCLRTRADRMKEIGTGWRVSDVWSFGWNVEDVAPGGVGIVRGLDRRHCPHGQYIADETGRGVGAGEIVRVLVTSRRAVESDGSWIAVGRGIPPIKTDAQIIRTYLNLNWRGRVRAARGIADTLDRYETPYCMKVMVDQDSQGRPDAFTLYFDERYLRIVMSAVRDVALLVSEDLGIATPLFTKRVADGIAMAQEPVTSTSFGIDRCAAVAEGVRRAWRRGRVDFSSRLESTLQVLDESAIDAERPYLRIGDADRFEL
jgi:hypothetical protein